MTITYTVFDPQDSNNVFGSGLSVEDAATEILRYDSNSFDIRPEHDGGFRLWCSEFSEASTLGGRPKIASAIFSLKNNETEARAEIFERVLIEAGAWAGVPDWMTDEDFREYQAQFEDDE